MDESIARIIAGIQDFDRLAIFEENARARDRLSPDVLSAIASRRAELGRAYVASRTGLDLATLTPAEEGIVRAVGEYAGIKKRAGTNAVRTIEQIKRVGLVAAAEASVMKSRPTQGYETLADADMSELSYEQIIVDHPDEFSARAIWYARKTLGLPNQGDKPPARDLSASQLWTGQLIDWLETRAAVSGGLLGGHSNAEAAEAIGLSMATHARSFGNVQSRVDFACFQAGLPPLGLTASQPFAEAWGTGDRHWDFPIEDMRSAALAFHWRPQDFDRIRAEAAGLPASAHVSWSKALSGEAESVRTWAMGVRDIPKESQAPSILPVPSTRSSSGRNPDWTREEHTLGLDLFLRFRGTTYPDEHPEVVRLSQNLRILARLRGMSGDASFRNPNSVSMKMQNFRRLDPQYEGVGLSAGAAGERLVWEAYAEDPPALASAVSVLMKEIDGARDDDVMADLAPSIAPDGQYWVFVNNPSKWAIDRFLETGRTEDSWGINPHDQAKFFPGQLGFVRVGVDARGNEKRQGRPKLDPGIYALVEVASVVFPGSGAGDEYWDEDSKREPGWPTVELRYLRSYLGRPLTIERLKREVPHISPSLLNGRQASSFALSADDFHAVMTLLEEDVEHLPDPTPPPTETVDEIAAAEKKFVNASPEVKTRVSKSIERGPIGNLVKKANGYKCQLCEAMGRNPLGFKKRSGIHYIEAHHVMPVSTKQIGVLSATNIMTLCANHHREIHYGTMEVAITEGHFEIRFDGAVHRISKVALDRSAGVQAAE